VKAESLSRRAERLLRDRARTLSPHLVTIGLDGFVDEIVTVVDKRESATRFTRVSTITALSRRIARAAGKSSNIELAVNRRKLGGNGPIMANAMAAFGFQVNCIGSLGFPQVHPAFAELAARATIYSIADPGLTDALEFDDGKLMLGKQQMLKDVNWHNLVERVGKERLVTLFSTSNLIALQSWTMLPFMSEIWEHILAEICPRLTAGKSHIVFFDLADPEKRDAKDIRHALELISRFQNFFTAYLGLNEKESFEIAAVLGYKGNTDGEAAVKEVSEFILEKLKIAGVVVHPREYAVVAAPSGTSMAAGPFVEKPLISTGAGDHFNAGFCLGKLVEADNEIALQLGVATSGYYVRAAKSPSLSELADFLHSL
jgi:ketohexokinase